MKREEAVQVLRDIINVCAGNSVVVTSVFLIPPSNDSGITGYQLKIGTKLDYTCRMGLMPLLKKNELEMEENEDHILIFKRQ